eukprot:5611117-Amphidinium_carterae.1
MSFPVTGCARFRKWFHFFRPSRINSGHVQPSHYTTRSHELSGTDPDRHSLQVQAWRQQAVDYLKERMGDTAARKVENTTRRRAFLWLASTEQTLHSLTGQGWERFKVPDNPSDEVLASWPGITVACDQGGDGHSALRYLLSRGYNIHGAFDPSHRCWNDVKLAIRQAGLWPLLLAGVCLSNFDSAPWASSGFWSECQSAATELQSLESESSVLMSFHRPRAERQLGIEGLSAEDRDAAMLRAVREVWDRKIQKIGLSRWFQWSDSMASLVQKWNTRLITLQYIASGKSSSSAPGKVIIGKASAASSSTDRATTAKDASKDGSVKGPTAGVMQVCTTLMEDSACYAIQAGMLAVIAPCKKWYSDQNTRLRSASESRSWFLEQASGACWTHLQETWE